MKQLALLLTITILFSCTDSKEEAKELVRTFFSTATTSPENASSYYPEFDSLQVSIRSDILDLSDDVKKIKDTFIIEGQNNYTDQFGTFKQDNIKLFVKRNKSSNKLEIFNSEGLFVLSDKMKGFANHIGIDCKELRDLELSKESSKFYKFYYHKYWESYQHLSSNLTILNWNWKLDYSYEPRVEAWIMNKSNMPIRKIKYSIKYYDANGVFISEDKGDACKELSPKEKYRFSFYSNHVKNPARARLTLNFDDSNIDDLIFSKNITEVEFNEYINNN